LFDGRVDGVMTERPVDDPMVGYTCGDCGEMRAWENVEMVEHPLDERHKFPICVDTDCAIENVTLHQ
jgi:hypothetical protein